MQQISIPITLQNLQRIAIASKGSKQFRRVGLRQNNTNSKQAHSTNHQQCCKHHHGNKPNEFNAWTLQNNSLAFALYCIELCCTKVNTIFPKNKIWNYLIISLVGTILAHAVSICAAFLCIFSIFLDCLGWNSLNLLSIGFVCTRFPFILSLCDLAGNTRQLKWQFIHLIIFIWIWVVTNKDLICDWLKSDFQTNLDNIGYGQYKYKQYKCTIRFDFGWKIKSIILNYEGNTNLRDLHTIIRNNTNTDFKFDNMRHPKLNNVRKYHIALTELLSNDCFLRIIPKHLRLRGGATKRKKSRSKRKKSKSQTLTITNNQKLNSCKNSTEKRGRKRQLSKTTTTVSVKKNRRHHYYQQNEKITVTKQYNAYEKKYKHGDFLIDQNIAWSNYRCDVKKYEVGEQNVYCSHCKAKFWHDERIGYKSTQKRAFGAACCKNGAIDIPLPRKLTPYLKSLFFGFSKEAIYFRENIRAFNGMFTFASIKSAFNPRKQNTQSNRAPYVFRCQGLLYHWIGPLEAKVDKTPVGLQIYMHDNEEAMEYRCNMFDLENKPLAKQIIKKIQREITKHNPWISQFKTMYEQNKDKKIPVVHLRIEKNPNIPAGRHKKQYTHPTANQVGALVKRHKAPNVQEEHKELILTLRHQTSTSNARNIKPINEDHGICDPATYPLLLPHGTEGWSKDMQAVSGVSCLEYYRYLLHKRVNKNQLDVRNPFLEAGKLSQQFLVDMWVKVDQLRLNTYKTKAAQNKIQKYYRADKYSANQEDSTLPDREFSNVLPSSYIGGARYMNQRMHDALAIVRKYKKADFFITMTVDPKDAEIKKHLSPGDYNSANRADVVRRIFEMKKKYLLYLLIDKEIFGAVEAFTWSVEYQKRGLPHIHLILILKKSARPKSIRGYDQFISAQIPNKEVDPELYDLVTRLMIHKNCEHYKKQPCLKNGHCTKHFPKDFCSKTKGLEDGYVQHKRKSPQDGGYSYQDAYTLVTNRWVVPYNPGLLKALQCHINVECVANVECVKYIFKYVQKHSDRASITMSNANEENYQTVDEIALCEDCRYICPYEAYGHLNSFKHWDNKPSVTRLPIYVDKFEKPYWDANNPLTFTRALKKNEKTKITEFFRNNALEKKNPLTKKQRTIQGKEGPHGFDLKYFEYPEWYAWKQKKNEWSRRVINTKRPPIGRIHLTQITERVRHFMRLLLLVKVGPTSWINLRTTVNGDGVRTIHPSYIAACKALGLLEDDKEHFRCLQEACFYHNARALRTLFVTLLRWSQPVEPKKLWNHFKKELCSDIRNKEKSKKFTQKIFNTGLLKIHEHLLIYKRTIGYYGFALPKSSECCLNDKFGTAVREELDYDKKKCKELSEEAVKKFNKEQNNIFTKIKKTIDKKNPTECFYIDGNAGSGKSFVANAILRYVRSLGQIAIATATTGIASTVLFGARTFHSRFNVPFDINAYDCEITRYDVSGKSGVEELIQKAKLIVIDEITTLSKHAIEVLNHTLQFITKSKKFMGGKIVILMGDFKQCLPITDGDWMSSVVACVNKSYIWPNFTSLRLMENKRLDSKDEQSILFAKQILKIGCGKFLTHTIGEINNLIQIPKAWLSKAKQIDEFIAEIYGDLTARYQEPNYLVDRTILTPLNKDVWDINDKLLKAFPGTEYLKKSRDMLSDPELNWHYPKEDLWKFRTGGFPLHELKLKIGVPVILLRNIASREGLCNGTRMLVEDIQEHTIVCRLVTGTKKGQLAFIHRISLNHDNKQVYLPFHRQQFPLQLAFAMTCHKAQGQTLKHVGLYLPTPVFAHGQLYTALSRVTHPKNLTILIENTETQGTFVGYDGIYTKNIVHKQALNKYSKNGKLLYAKHMYCQDDYYDEQAEQKMNDS